MRTREALCCRDRLTRPPAQAAIRLSCAIGRAWGWRRRMEAGELNTVTDLAKAEGLAERHVSRRLRPACLAPGVLKRLVHKREVPSVTLLKLTDVAALPWHEQPERVFDGASVKARLSHPRNMSGK